MNEIRGDFQARGRRFALVVARFNELVTSKLLDGALDCLRAHGIAEEDLVVAWVPAHSSCRWSRAVWRSLAGTTR